MKKLRVLVLMHEDLVPPDDFAGYSEAEIDEWKTEYDVVGALNDLGHEVKKLGVSDELRPIRRALAEWKPDIVFNLLEEFRGEALFDWNVVGYLELLGVPYTGCNPRGMVLSRDKALSKQVLAYHRIRVPEFAVFRRGRKLKRPKRLAFPLIVKSVIEDASLGISQASIVRDDDQLADRVQFIHARIGTDAIAEQFVEGRELYMGILGDQRLRAFPPQELVFKKRRPGDAPLLATARIKHDLEYQKRWGVDLRLARNLSEEARRQLERTSKRIYRALDLGGYARIDFRLDAEGRFYFLEVNPNPDIARYEEFASAAEAAGVSYERLVQAILRAGLRRRMG